MARGRCRPCRHAAVDRVNLHRVVPGFPEGVRLEEQAELVNDFAAAANTIVVAVDVEEILHGSG